MKQDVTSPVVIPDAWDCDCRGRRLHGLGNRALLSHRLTAFFASRVCPASAIRAGMAWTMEQIRAQQTLIGGFHSPLEHSVLHLLLEARSPVVVVLARDVGLARLPTTWRAAIKRDHMTVVSADGEHQRLDRLRAAGRNDLVAALSDSIVVAHMSAGGTLASQVEAWDSHGKPVRLLQSESC